jgi:hypothetical protein
MTCGDPSSSLRLRWIQAEATEWIESQRTRWEALFDAVGEDLEERADRR